MTDSPRIVGIYTSSAGVASSPYVEITWARMTPQGEERTALVLYERDAMAQGVYDAWRALVDLHRVLVPSVAEAARRVGGEP